MNRPAGGATAPLGRTMFRSLLAVGVVSFASLLAVPASAATADPLDCNQQVVDTSGEVDVAAVSAAIAEVNPEVTIVVRTFDEVADGDLVAAIDDIVVACFGDDQNGVSPETIVLGLSVDDRLSDVLIGGRWTAAVPSPDEIRENVMGPSFAEGDYTAGLLAAIDEIDGRVGSVPTIVQEDPTSGSGRSPWGIAGGVVGIGLCGGVVFGVSRLRRLSAARQHLEKSMAGPRARVGMVRERDGRLASQAEIWAKTTAGRTLASMRGLERESEHGRMEVDRSVALLTQIVPHGPQKVGLSEIERGQKRVIELSRALDTHDEILDRLAAFGAHIDHLRVALPAKQDLLEQEIDEALGLAEQRASEGWAVDGQITELKVVFADVEALDFEMLDLDLLSLSDQIEASEAQLFSTDHYLQSLPSRVPSLKKWSGELEKTAELELGRVEDLRRQFSKLAATHASDSWQWAADYPEQALDYLNQADATQDTAISLISEQQFDQAGAQLDRAGLQIIAADKVLDQVDDLLVDLDRAREEAPSILGQCREILADLITFVAQHRVDLDLSFDAQPEVLSRAIEGLEMELRQVKPNFLRVAETGDRVNRRIDDLFIAAQDQHARMQAMRRELRRETARAERSIVRARRSLGWEIVQSSDASSLEHLGAKLNNLPADVEAAIEVAAHIADDALRIQERVIARRRRRGTWVTTGGGGWTAGGGGWSSGGSSWSGGGSRSSSGSGRSFGSRSSGGGGRSFGGGRSSGSF